MLLQARLRLFSDGIPWAYCMSAWTSHANPWNNRIRNRMHHSFCDYTRLPNVQL